MNRYMFIFFFFFTSCVNSNLETNSEPKIDTDVMKQILLERHLLLAQITSFQYPDSLSNTIVDSLFNNICLKKGISKQEFDQSWKHYNTKEVDQLIKVYDSVIEELKVMELKDQ